MLEWTRSRATRIRCRNGGMACTSFAPLSPSAREYMYSRLSRETNLDDVLQISNVFVNVSKGEVAKHADLQKAFGTSNVNDVIKEVCTALSWIANCHL